MEQSFSSQANSRSASQKFLAFMELDGSLSCSQEPATGLNTTNRLIPWNRIVLEKLTVTQRVNKFLACYGTRKFSSVHKSPPLLPN